jgi:hypothetical protein
MLEINSLEASVLALWVVGAAAGLWLYLSARSVQSALILVLSVVVPVIGSVTALAFALVRHRSLRTT